MLHLCRHKLSWQGIFKDLMNKAIEICEKRNRIVSFVIAEKADYFYNKFSFLDYQISCL